MTLRPSTSRRLSRQVHAEGAKRIAVVTDEPDKYPVGTVWAPGVSIHHRGELDAGMDAGAGRPDGADRVLVRLVGHHGDALGAFGMHLAGDQRRIERPVMGLAAGHRHR